MARPLWRMHDFRLYFDQPTPIANLERRVRLQEAALLQARQDLADAQERAGGTPGSSPFLSAAHETLYASEQRRRSGLGPVGAVQITAESVIAADRRRREGFSAPPEPTDPFVREVIAADRKRRGLDPLAVLPTVRATPEGIIAAMRKANLGRK